MIRNQTAFVERIFLRMAQGHKFGLLLKLRELQRGSPGYGFEGGLERPLKIAYEFVELSLTRRFVEAAYSGRNRMDLTAAQQLHKPIADLLQPQCSFDNG